MNNTTSSSVTFESMIQTMKKFSEPKNEWKTICCHPNNVIYLHKDYEEIFTMDIIRYQSYTLGVDIYIDKNLPEFVPEWTFPADPFIEYEESDKVWAIPLKIGCWKPSNKRAYYLTTINGYKMEKIMKKEIKELWVDALLSGKYTQGKQQLRVEDDWETNTTHCCLGVLCDIRAKKMKKKVWDKEIVGSESYLSDKISEWADLDQKTQEKLAEFNDNGRSFKWIAAYIKRYL